MELSNTVASPVKFSNSVYIKRPIRGWIMGGASYRAVTVEAALAAASAAGQSRLGRAKG